MTQVIFCKALGFNILLIRREQKAGLHLKFWEQNVKQIQQAVVGKYAGRPLLSLKRTIAGRKQGRRFKAVSANETQRVRTDCFVRMLGISDKDYRRHTYVLIFSRALCDIS